MTVKTCSGARLQTDTLESLQGESCHKMQVPTGGIGDELDKERQREWVGNLDVLGSTYWEISYTKAAGGIIVGSPRHKPNLSLPVASNQLEWSHNREIGAEGALAVSLLIVVACKESLPRHAHGTEVITSKALECMALSILFKIEERLVVLIVPVIYDAKWESAGQVRECQVYLLPSKIVLSSSYNVLGYITTPRIHSVAVIPMLCLKAVLNVP